MDHVVANEHVQVLIPPDAGKRDTPRPGWHGGRYTAMREELATDYGGGLYRRRKVMVELVFAQTKHKQPAHQSVSATRQIRRALGVLADGLRGACLVDADGADTAVGLGEHVAAYPADVLRHLLGVEDAIALVWCRESWGVERGRAGCS
jgi:hypothetical protein